MRVAMFHNRYARRGGEDEAFDREVDLLRKAGCEVFVFEVDSDEVRGPLGTARAALSARSGRGAALRIARFLAEHAVDVGHVHNFFPLLASAVHETLFALRIPVVQTLHNYRLFCARGDFLREGRTCEACVAAGPWNAVRHGCWRGSRAATAFWADATARQRRRRVWERVARFVAPSEFAAAKLAAAGLDGERLRVVPDPVIDPGAVPGAGDGAVYVGRLSPEKGVELLLDAWRSLPGVPLTVVGDGPEAGRLRERAAALPQVHFVGEQPGARVRERMAAAGFLVAPSLCYETFGLAPAEALALGRPIVVPRGTALAELAAGGRNGRLFEPGDPGSLAAACRELAGDAALRRRLGAEARAHFEDALAPTARTERLLGVYGEALSGVSA